MISIQLYDEIYETQRAEVADFNHGEFWNNLASRSREKIGILKKFIVFSKFIVLRARAPARQESL